jgi:hypothetical protein
MAAGWLYGSSTYSGGLPLEWNQKLIGEANGLTVSGNALVPATGGTATNNPTIQNAGGDAIQLAKAPSSPLSSSKGYSRPA